MTEPSTPDDPQGLAGVSIAPRSSAPSWTRIITKPWFWVPVMASFWLLPLLKSLDVEMPEPPGGWERGAETLELVDLEGRELSLTDLEGSLKVVMRIDMTDPIQGEKDFHTFRALKKHLRHMGMITVYLLLVEGADRKQLVAFLDGLKARKPNSLYLLDAEGAEFGRLQASAGQPQSICMVLDRHGRVRGSSDGDPAGELEIFRAMTLLGNWPGCDPALGAPVTR
jgi:hypothetical protein